MGVVLCFRKQGYTLFYRKKERIMKKALFLILALILCLSLYVCNNHSVLDSTDNSTDNSVETIYEDTNTTQKTTIPNNEDWDQLLCDGDGYYLVAKTIDAYNEYKVLVGVVNQDGEWIQELTCEGAFADGVWCSVIDGDILLNPSCFYYLGEGVFLASPGVSVYTNDESHRVGPRKNTISYDYTGDPDLKIWQCLTWNVKNNSQQRFGASKMSVFQDGFLLFCAEEAYGGGTLRVMDINGEIRKLPCKYLPNKPGHNFPVYSEGLFYACDDEHSDPGFYDIEGNRVIDLSEYEVGFIWYSASQRINAPYFENGQAIILLKNANDTVFKAVIDKTGALVGEPQKMEGDLTYG